MSSKCDSYREKIAAWALDDLPDADRRELEAHLDGCKQCRLEKESFEQTVKMLALAEDEPAPRHFFIAPDTHPVSPWRFFLQTPFPLRAAFAGMIVLAILLSGAALSQFHVRVDPHGWSMGFGRGDIDTKALREEFLQAAAEDSQKNQRQFMEVILNEVAHLYADEDRRVRELEGILSRLDSRIDGRVERSEEQTRSDMQIMVAVMYQELTRQWALDVEVINLRLELAELRDFLKARDTEDILGTLLQIANMNMN